MSSIFPVVSASPSGVEASQDVTGGSGDLWEATLESDKFDTGVSSQADCDVALGPPFAEYRQQLLGYSSRCVAVARRSHFESVLYSSAHDEADCPSNSRLQKTASLASCSGRRAAADYLLPV